MIHVDSLTPWQWALVAVAVTLILQEVHARQKRAHNPPGPPPLPLIGNAFDVPPGHPGRGFHELSKKYGESNCVDTSSTILPSLCSLTGDLVYLSTLGQSILVIGSYKVARELLDKKSGNYSDRPQSVMINLYVLSDRLLCIALSLSGLQHWDELHVHAEELWKSMAAAPPHVHPVVQRRRSP